MISIIRATEEDAELIAAIARTTFIESHGHSAPADDIETYVKEKYQVEVLRGELQDQHNIYHLIKENDTVAGYSKIIPYLPFDGAPARDLTKLERIYLLSTYHGSKLGITLLDFNIRVAKELAQSGMWLYVWTENHRAIRFYQRGGFKVAGRHMFPLSATHSNPNHMMFLRF